MTEPLHKFVVIAFKVGSVFSLGGCGYVIQEVIRDKEKRSKTYFRLILGLCIAEFIESMALFCGTWCAPSYWKWWGSSGNETTCNFQGFITQVSIGSSMYSAFLAVYYILSIRYNMLERNIRKYVEPWMHISAFCWCFGSALAILILDLIRPLGTICYIGRTPPTCKQTYKYGYSDCIQGDNAQLYSIIFYYSWYFAAFVLSFVCMLIVYTHIRRQENRMASYAFRTPEAPNRKLSKRFATQMYLYMLVLWLCNVWSTINFTMIHIVGKGFVQVSVLGAVFKPLEGFFNFLIYMRPRWLRSYRNRRENQRRFTTDISEEVVDGTNTASNGTEEQEGATESGFLFSWIRRLMGWMLWFKHTPTDSDASSSISKAEMSSKENDGNSVDDEQQKSTNSSGKDNKEEPTGAAALNAKEIELLEDAEEQIRLGAC